MGLSLKEALCREQQLKKFTVTLKAVLENQGWEFTRRFSEQITCFLPKNEQMSDSLKKIWRFTHLLVFGERFSHHGSFPLSNLSESLMVAPFW